MTSRADSITRRKTMRSHAGESGQSPDLGRDGHCHRIRARTAAGRPSSPAHALPSPPGRGGEEPWQLVVRALPSAGEGRGGQPVPAPDPGRGEGGRPPDTARVAGSVRGRPTPAVSRASTAALSSLPPCRHRRRLCLPYRQCRRRRGGRGRWEDGEEEREREREREDGWRGGGEGAPVTR
uniref:Uncharacterized protein n=1 Tax=Oryza sativa subsp. japonica TaxID=39947 RepID=Q5Z706_ORYSJ|nr:hypothetical protein [Oryza sativa Japonica Group]